MGPLRREQEAPGCKTAGKRLGVHAALRRTLGRSMPSPSAPSGRSMVLTSPGSKQRWGLRNRRKHQDHKVPAMAPSQSSSPALPWQPLPDPRVGSGFGARQGLRNCPGGAGSVAPAPIWRPRPSPSFQRLSCSSVCLCFSCLCFSLSSFLSLPCSWLTEGSGQTRSTVPGTPAWGWGEP